MAGELERLLVRLDADTTALRNALNNASKDTETWEKKTNKSVGGSKRIYDDFAKGAAAALTRLGAAFGAATIVNFASSALADAAALANLSQAAGLTTTQFQALRFASRSAGVDITQFDTAVSQFAAKMGEFRSKSGELYTFLRDQLPAGRELLANTRNQSEALEAAAKIVANLSSAEDKAAFVKRAFNESATSLIPVLEKLASEGFAGVTAKAREYGAVIDKEAIEESKKLKTEIDLLSASLTAGLQQALGTAAGYINRFAKELSDASKNAKATSIGGANLDEIKSIEKELSGLDGKLQKLWLTQKEMENVSGPWARNAAHEAAILELRVRDLTNRLESLRDGGGKVAADTMREVAAAAKEASQWVTTLAENPWSTESTGDQSDWAIAKKPNTAGTDAVTAQHVARLQAEGKFTQAIEVEYAAQVEKFQRMLDQELISEAQFLQAREDANVALAGKILQAYEESNKYAKAGMMEVRNTISGPVMDAFDDWITKGKVDSEAMFKSILANMAKMLFQALILKPIMDSLFSAVGGPGAGLFSIIGGMRADGGPVSASTPYIVGEKGPELFVPSAHGNIVPNGAMRGGSGSTTTYSYVIDARGADIGVADKIAAVLRSQMAMQPSAPAALAAYGRRFPTRR